MYDRTRPTVISRALMYHECSGCKEDCSLKNAVGINGMYSKYLEVEWCRRCGDGLDIAYSIIIQKLRKQNLLPDDFEPKCCDCFNIEEYVDKSLVQLP